jgi:serine phosphatase RsbU (regulator of sigma subunit)
VLEWVNEAIANSNQDTFCTVVYSTLERDELGAWHYACALGGHPRPIVIPQDRPAHAIGAFGSLIGVLPAITTSTVDIDLQPGDTVLLYTDGVTDLRPPNGLDEAELLAVVEGARVTVGSADVVAAGLGRAIQALVPIDERHDDVALLVVRIDPGAVNEP